MRHCNRVLPGRLLRVSYDGLVEELRASMRQILAHCGPEFDPARLAFHRSRRAINTPSSEQVTALAQRTLPVAALRSRARSLRETPSDAIVRYRD